MTFATVNVLPQPVMPSSTCDGSPRFTPAHSSSMARGWSPVGWSSVCRRNGVGKAI